jgi:hypothetical protein
MLAAAALLTGCVLDPVSVEGKACDAERPCGAGFRCVSATCEGDGGVKNLLTNGDFEAGVTGWSPQNASSGLEAQQSVRIEGSTARFFGKTNGPNGARLSAQAIIPSGSSTGPLCADAQIRVENFRRNVHLAIGHLYADGGSSIGLEELFEPGSFVDGAQPQPQVARVHYFLDAGAGNFPVMVVLLGSPNVSLADVFYADNVRVWELAGAGVCRQD